MAEEGLPPAVVDASVGCFSKDDPPGSPLPRVVVQAPSAPPGLEKVRAASPPPPASPDPRGTRANYYDDDNDDDMGKSPIVSGKPPAPMSPKGPSRPLGSGTPPCTPKHA